MENSKRYNMTLPQKILREALARVAECGFTHTELYKMAGMSSKGWNEHWSGKTTFMTPTTESNINIAVATMRKGKK